MSKIKWFFLLLAISTLQVHSQDRGLRIGQVPPELDYHSFGKDELISFKGKDFDNTVFLIDF